MSVKLEITSNNGNINLTKYLNVEKGAGMDPADPTFTNKVFAHSLLKKGGTLALEDLKLREQSFPLRLTAKSKDALTALVRELNVILNTSGAQVAWTDEGASNPTLLYLASGQFDVEFDYRQGEKFMVKGKLRLFSQPLAFGNNGVFRELPLVSKGTSAGTAPVVMYRTASPINGDAPATARINFESEPFSKSWAFAFSVLPNASYIPWMPAASSLEGTTWAAGATAGFKYAVGGGGEAHPISFAREAGIYLGDHRVLAIARLFNNASNATMSALTPFNTEAFNVKVPIPAASGGQPWSVVDLGVARGASLTAIGGLTAVQVYSAATIALYGLVMLPETSTSWLYDREADGSVEFDGLAERILHTGGNTKDRTGIARGAIPEIPPGIAAPVVALFSFPPEANQPVNVQTEVSVLERYRYAV